MKLDCMGRTSLPAVGVLTSGTGLGVISGTPGRLGMIVGRLGSGGSVAPGPMRRGGCVASGAGPAAGTPDGTGVLMSSGAATGTSGVLFGAMPGAGGGAMLADVAGDGA